jgi:hypothetical protein
MGAALLSIAVPRAQSVQAAPAGLDVANRVAAYLEHSQLKEGARMGMWPSEPSFAGPPTAGLTCAYQWIGDRVYLEAAERGGEYILWIGDSTGHLLGDESYALAGLSELSENPEENRWRSTLTRFYNGLHSQGGITTAGYIDLLTQGDPSHNVFYLAHHTVTAHYVDDADKEVWRTALIRCLASVDDRSSYPVQALGVATWALARTGELGETVVDSADSGSCWSGVMLKDLPVLLLSHQIPDGEPFAGSFYWHFDHADPEIDVVAGGWTEDAIFGTLGLVAAASGQQGEDAEGLKKAVEAAYAALLEASDADGKVCGHVSGIGVSYYTYAGELLQTLWTVQQYLDTMESVAAENGGALPPP